VPVVTMRLFAEERRAGTLELLLTSPIKEIEIVLAKFTAGLSLPTLMLALTGSYAAVLGVYGDPDWGPIYSGFLGLLLLAAALTSIGLLVSGLTANQIVAAVITMGVGILLWMIDTLGYLLPEPFDWIVSHLSLVAHFTPFATGAIFLSDAGFFLTIVLLGLFLSARALSRR
jgi:ABC-2 type transport system permease protein